MKIYNILAILLVNNIDNCSSFIFNTKNILYTKNKDFIMSLYDNSICHDSVYYHNIYYDNIIYKSHFNNIVYNNIFLDKNIINNNNNDTNNVKTNKKECDIIDNNILLLGGIK